MACSLDRARHDLQTVWHPCTQMTDHEWLPIDALAATARAGIEAATCD